MKAAGVPRIKLIARAAIAICALFHRLRGTWRAASEIIVRLAPDSR